MARIRSPLGQPTCGFTRARMTPEEMALDAAQRALAAEAQAATRRFLTALDDAEE